MSQLTTPSFPTACPEDTGPSARGEESTVLGLQNPLVLSKLGEGAQVGKQP